MLNLSDFRISFVKSTVYRRLAFIIYSASFLILFSSGLLFSLKLGIAFLLAYQLIRILHYPFPVADCKALSLNNNLWLVENNDAEQTIYEQLRILIDTDIFILIELRMQKKRKLLVIFSDQLSKTELSVFKIAEKIN